MRASDVPRATEPSLSTALRLRLSRRRKSTRRHWPRASLRRMNSRPYPSGRRACLVSPLVGGKLLPFPRRVGCPTCRRQSEQRRARAYCPVHPPPAAPELNHLAAHHLTSDHSRTLTLQRLAQIGPRHSSPHSNDLSLRLGGAGGGSDGYGGGTRLDSSYDYGHRGQREPRVRTRPRLIVWGSVDGGRFYTRSRI